MKLKFVFVILQSLVFSFKLFAVPDTIWTNNFAVNGQPIFTSDGSKIIINGWECISASDGQTLWHNDAAEEHFYYFITHDDSCVVSRQSDQIKYYSINSGNLVRSLDTIYKKKLASGIQPT